MNKALFMVPLFLAACAAPKEQPQVADFVEENTQFAKEQVAGAIKVIEEAGDSIVLNPIKLNADGTVFYGRYADWRSGFFPGTVWNLYRLTGDETLLPLARKYTEAISQAQYLTSHHDIGFIINCSFGNGLEIAGIEDYKNVMIEAAKSLSTRFHPEAGIIQSWDADKGWQAEKGWECPVIIDNMMNLELLFKATQLSGDSLYHKIAVSHADRTLKEHFRQDGSCYHVVDYGLRMGDVRNRQTAQGYSDESIWSRGQAWAIYGYTTCYRFTKDQKYLDQAIRTFNMMRNHENAPEDLIPYWDMLCPDIPDTYRDASSASLIASALYEISTTGVENAAGYKDYADRMMASLASESYRSKPGENGNFILMHSVGSIPHNNEIDVPLNYADYYFVEALYRKKMIEAK